jgi:ribonuclease Z
MTGTSSVLCSLRLSGLSPRHAEGVRITFLGTASGVPTRSRNVTSQALTLDTGAIWLLDCGEATQHRCMKAGLRATRIERILLTHLHGDHCYGLPGILSSISIQGRTDPVEIVGPIGVRELVETVLRLSDATMNFPLSFIEIPPGGSLRLSSRSGWSVEARSIAHRIACFGYALQEDSRPGRFHPERARRLGIPSGPLWGRLQAGNTVTLADGRVIEPDAVGEPPRRGRKVILLGDTSDASGIADLAQHCDLLVHETTYDASRVEKAAQWGHSTTAMTGAFAARVAAKRLIITHFSARYTDTSSRNPLRPKDLLRETASLCPDTVVLAADDLWEFTVPKPEDG